jgi:hypothetical protein
VDNRRKIVTAALVAAATLAGTAIADPFDMSPRDVGNAVNDRLRLADLDLRFELERCVQRELIECHFSSAQTFLVATGRARPPRTREIMIAADLLATDAASDVHERVTKVIAALRATMEIFDVKLQPSRRSKLLSDLPGMALRDGHSEDSGINAHYSLAFDQGANGLLAITVVPKR